MNTEKITKREKSFGAVVPQLVSGIQDVLASQQHIIGNKIQQKYESLTARLGPDVPRVTSWVLANLTTIHLSLPFLTQFLYNSTSIKMLHFSSVVDNFNKVFVYIRAVEQLTLSNVGVRVRSPPALQKLRFTGDSFNNLSPGFSKGLSLTLTVTKPTLAKSVCTLIRRVFPSNKIYTDEVVIQLFKEVSAVYKKVGPKLAPGRDWMAFTNLETCGGYRDPTSHLDLNEEARNWVAEPKVYNPDMTNSRAVRFGLLDELLKVSKPRLPEQLSLIDYLSDPTSFATTGSGRGLPRLDATVYAWKDNRMDTYSTTLPSTKWAGFLATPPDKLVDMALSPVKQHNRMFIKPDELTKLRSIVTGDVPTLLKMAYVGHYAVAQLHDCAWLSLFWTDTTRALRWAEMARATKSDTWAMPIDQSAFDANVSQEILLDVVAWLNKLALAACPTDEMRVVTERLYYALDGGVLEVDGGETFDIKKGVLSGWLWTALLGSLINYLQFREICKAIALPFNEVINPVFQGDDVAIRLSTTYDAATIYQGYVRYGLDVNPNKFFIDKDRDEFLRLVPQDGSVKGYLNRLSSGLLWHRPGARPTDPVTEWSEQLDSWMRALSRDASPEVVLRLATSETSRIFGISVSDASRLLHTPTSAGGGGWTPFGNSWLAVQRDKQQRPKVVEVQSQLLSSLGVADQAYIVSLVLGAQLPSPPARAKPFTMVSPMHISPSILLRPLDLTREVYRSDLPHPIWRRTNTLVRLAAMHDAIDTKDDEKILELVENPETVWRQRRLLGRRTWIDWLSGSFLIAPRTKLNPVYVKIYTDYLLVVMWHKIGLLTPKTVSIYIEMAVHTALEMTKTFVGY